MCKKFTIRVAEIAKLVTKGLYKTGPSRGGAYMSNRDEII